MEYYDVLADENASTQLKRFGYSKIPFRGKVVGLKELRRAGGKAITLVRGGSLELNRKIVRSGADVLLDPVAGSQLTVDTAVVQVANDNDVTFGISLRQFLNTGDHMKARMIGSYRKLVLLCTRGKARILLTSGATSRFEVRTPMQLASFGKLLGMTHNQARWSISKVPEYLIRKKTRIGAV